MTAWWRRRRAQVQQAEPMRLPAVAAEGVSLDQWLADGAV